MDKTSTYIDILIGVIIASGIQYLANIRTALYSGADWRVLMNPTIDISAFMFLIAVVLLFILIIIRGHYANKESAEHDARLANLIEDTVKRMSILKVNDHF